VAVGVSLKFFCHRLHFSFAYVKHALSTWLGPGNTALLGPEIGPTVMEIVANSPSDRRQVGQQKDPQWSSVITALVVAPNDRTRSQASVTSAIAQPSHRAGVRRLAREESGDRKRFGDHG
jgi:hypothetical protein